MLGPVFDRIGAGNCGRSAYGQGINNRSNDNNTLHRMILQAERPTVALGVI